MISAVFVPWVKLGTGRLLVMPEVGLARVEPPPPGTPCQHPSSCYTGAGFPSYPHAIVPICPDCLTVLGVTIWRDA